MVSKTKLGATLIGLSALIGTLGAWFSGTIETQTAITSIITEVGVVIGIYGLRDLPVINKTK